MKKIKYFIRDLIWDWLRKHPSYVPIDIKSPIQCTERVGKYVQFNSICEMPKAIWETLSVQKREGFIIRQLGNAMVEDEDFLKSLEVKEVDSLNPNIKSFMATIYIAKDIH